MERIAAHAITFRDKTHKMSVLELADDGTIEIRPLDREIHSTQFFSGHITVSLSPDGKLIIKQMNHLK